uniref:Uncharacterized protein n=1 Tax=Rhizophora mucronata TaxID=61149 RepID=A0A2P2QA98_RHIMU
MRRIMMVFSRNTVNSRRFTQGT